MSLSYFFSHNKLLSLAIWIKNSYYIIFYYQEELFFNKEFNKKLDIFTI